MTKTYGAYKKKHLSIQLFPSFCILLFQINFSIS
jgi:hypothetical protein